MKCTIPEISWHNRDPVLSVDIQPAIFGNGLYRLASGGTDSHVLIWYMTINKTGSVNLDLAADLTRHQRAVNVVKWSANGVYLASGDDESAILIWKQKGENERSNIDTTNEQDKEIWITFKILRGHMEDIYDLSWSQNSEFLVSGSVDNTAMIWDVQKGKCLYTLNDHKGFVQGVAWDPLNQYIATLSSDRYIRIFDIQTKKVLYRNSKCNLPVTEGQEFCGKKIRIYHDDTLQTFFRRLCFSPDGKLLIAPAGVTDYDGCTKHLHTTYIYSRYSLKQPAIVLPSPDQYTVAVKCCPVLFKLRPHTESNIPVVPLPYRIIFAVATKSSVFLYDTQQKMPFGLISDIHYTRLTDLTWSKDAKVLVVSSTDGFCSLITFSESELGEIYQENEPILETNHDVSNPEKDLNIKKSDQSKSEFGSNNIKEIYSNKTENKSSEKEAHLKEKIIVEKNGEQQKRDNLATLMKMNNTPQIFSVSGIKLPDTTLILDKNIISSAGKFETPEKNDRPATPITIRRYPRTVQFLMLPSDTSLNQVINLRTEFRNAKREKTSSTSVQNLKNQKLEISKTTRPIQIRRQPRVSIPNVVETPTSVEESVHSWPSNKMTKMEIDTVVEERNDREIERNKCIVISNAKHNNKSTGINEERISGTKNVILQNVDHTEDIRLIYEESQDEKQSEKFEVENKIESENLKNQMPKIPKRIELKTISTPGE